MKQLTCEMCGSTDLMKQDGVFVCQSCGCKYSVEEAKKMMIEGTVEITGTVKVDTSAVIEKLFINARQAYENEDWDNAEKYYSLIKRDIPENLEVTFFYVYCRAMKQLYDEDYLSRNQAFNALLKSMPLLNKFYNNTVEDKQTLNKVNNALQKMYSSTFVSILNATVGIGSYEWQKKLFKRVDNAFITELKNINQKYNESFIAEIITKHYKVEQEEQRKKDRIEVALQREKDQQEAEIKQEEAKSQRINLGMKIGAVVGGIIGIIVGILLGNITLDSISSPIGRLNNPPENDGFVMLVAYGAPILLGIFVGACIGGAIAERIK